MKKENRRNYYRLLHVQPDAPVEIIKSSYRTLMQRLRMHPDLGGDDWNAALINEAYAVLSDPDKRAAYDAERDRIGRTEAPEKPAAANETTSTPRPRAARRQHVSDQLCPFCHAGIELRIESDSVCPRCASPLARAANHARQADWLRALERVPRELPLKVWEDWPQPPQTAVLVDLSLTGLRLRLPRAVAENRFIKVDSELFGGIARVVHCRPAGPAWELGGEFYTLRFSRSRGAFVSAEA